MGRHSEPPSGDAPSRERRAAGDDETEEVVLPWLRRTPAPAGPMRWERRFALLVAAGDVAVVAASVAAGIAVLGLDAGARDHVVAGLVAGALLLAALPTMRAWEISVLGHGVTELARLGRAVVTAVIALGLAGLAWGAESVRPWVFAILPMAGVLCLASRFALRAWLRRERSAGRCVLNVLAVGSGDSVADLIRRTRRVPQFGWHVAAACTPTGTGPDGLATVDGVEVVGDLDSVAREARREQYRVVAVCRAAGWSPARLRRLAWDLEGSDAELVVDPGLMEVAGQRMHVTPIDGLPLLRLSRPRSGGTSPGA